MIRSFAVVMILGMACWGQVEGPYTLYEGTLLPAAQGFQVLAETDSTARVFYQLGSLTWMQLFDVEDGQVEGWPGVVGSANDGYLRVLEDAIGFDSGWALVAYDSSQTYNQTFLLWRSGDSVQTRMLDEATHHSTWQYGSGSMNDHIRLAWCGGDSIVMTWIDYWEVWVGFPEAGVAFDARRFSMQSGEQLGGGEYGGAWFDDAWALGAETDSPLVAGVYGSNGLCIDALYGNGWWSPCMDGGINCPGFPLAWLINQDGRILMLSRFSEAILEVDKRERECRELLTVDLDPIAGTSHSNYGIAWLSRLSGGLQLGRATTDAEQFLSPGALYWTEADHRILSTGLAISDGGKVMALWSEEQLSDPTIRRLQIAAVDWDTPLAAEPTSLIPAPSSLSLTSYPNPFNGALRIEYELERAQDVELSVMNVLGQQVAQLESGRREAGVHSVAWTPGGGTGIYFVRLAGESGVVTEKVMYLR